MSFPRTSIPGCIWPIGESKPGESPPMAGGLTSTDSPPPATHRTRFVTVSWVAFSNGWRHDLDRLAELVHGRGALLFLDAIQGPGRLSARRPQNPG